MAANAMAHGAALDSPLVEVRRLVRLEAFKLRRRPMPWIVLAILGGMAFGTSWLFYLTLGGLGTGSIGVNSRELLDRLVFPAVLDASVENAVSYGVPLLIVLAAANFGGEFAWGTVRLLLSRGESRRGYVLSKLAVICGWWGVMLAAAVGAGLVAGTTISVADGAPGPGSIGVGAWLAMGGRFLLAWVGASIYAILAAQFTVIFRSTAVGLASALMAFFGEGIIQEASAGVTTPLIDLFLRAGINYNLRSLLGTGDGEGNSVPIAAAVLIVYGVAMVRATIRHLSRHDVVVAGIG